MNLRLREYPDNLCKSPSMMFHVEQWIRASLGTDIFISASFSALSASPRSHCEANATRSREGRGEMRGEEEGENEMGE
jgi:hypothetical protein